MDARTAIRCCCLWAAALLTPPAWAQSEVTTASYVTIVNEVSRDFRDEVEEAWRSVPRPIREDLIRQGWRLKAAKFVVQAEPELRGQQPRGWPRDRTWWHTEAAHLPKKRLLIVAEKMIDKHGKVVRTDRAAEVLRHEIGHAYDRALTTGKDWESSSRTFVMCYARDVGGMSPQRREQLAYYTQPGSAGRQEAFAEAFAQVVGGGSDVTQSETFADAFPTVLRYMRAKVETSTRSERVATRKSEPRP